MLKVNNGYVLIDDEDFKLVSNYSWRIDSNGYVVHSYRTDNKVKRLYMHRLIMGNPSNPIDHKNHNTSDNRKSNLRICNASLNGANRVISKNNTTGAKGVVKTKYGTFRAFVTHQGKKRALGTFDSLEEATEARNNEFNKLFGEFAC